MKLAQFFQDDKLRLGRVLQQELFPLNFEGDFHAGLAESLRIHL